MSSLQSYMVGIVLVSVIYCSVTKHCKTQWYKTVTVDYFSWFYGWIVWVVLFLVSLGIIRVVNVIWWFHWSWRFQEALSPVSGSWSLLRSFSSVCGLLTFTRLDWPQNDGHRILRQQRWKLQGILKLSFPLINITFSAFCWSEYVTGPTLIRRSAVLHSEVGIIVFIRSHYYYYAPHFKDEGTKWRSHN